MKACLRWKRQSNRDQPLPQHCWDETPLHRWMTTSTEGDEEKLMSSGCAEISYDRLHVLLVLLVRRLHEMVVELLFTKDGKVRHDGHTSRISVPIAIAIPEGPYLPLTVAAVHALNDGSKFSAVIVPIDPDEGTERLRRILDDSKPLLMLVAADCHAKMVQQATTARTGGTSGTPQLYHVFDSSQPLHQSPDTRIMDIRKCISQLPELTEAGLDTTADGDTRAAILRQRLRLYESRIVESSRESLFAKDTINCISHIVYTSGTTGIPKGCVSSIGALDAYLETKNKAHGITSASVVLLASAVSFDPCISDVLATFNAGATLFLATRENLSNRLHDILLQGRITHVLCTPTLWSTLSIHHDANPACFPCLRVVALGGERIPQQISRTWARKSKNDESDCRLFATYGVTEACVYQTMGEVLVASKATVGLPFDGMKVFVCKEEVQDALVVSNRGELGELVLFGRQIDEYSAYLRRPELTKQKFQYNEALGGYGYRTGDRGTVDADTGVVQIVGRIDGETGMVKYNGVRVELGEIESAIVDDNNLEDAVVVDCMVLLNEANDVKGGPSLCAFVVLSKKCLDEMGIVESLPVTGVLCTGVLLALLVQRCKQRSRVTPSTFVLIPSIPLTRTGKRNKEAAPCLKNAVSLVELTGNSNEGVLLADYSPLGSLVAEQIIGCLNLLQCQLPLLTTSATFAMLGGDSLTATRVVRALYARHHDVFNSRQLGGVYGVLDDDTFSVRHLLQAPNLGEYVDFLQGNHVLQELQDSSSVVEESTGVQSVQSNPAESAEGHLYDLLLQSTMQGKTLLALALVRAGSPPNNEDKRKYRLSNTRGLQERKTIFHSTPLHFSCLKGLPQLTRVLLLKGAKFNIPDAAGMFPIHLAASRDTKLEEYSEEEDLRRSECVQLLLEMGAPLPMKDGNKHSVLHCAARSGLKRLLRFVMERWKTDLIADDNEKYSGGQDWRDRWSRTPVHWAILNGHVDALQILLENGCSPSPVLPKKNARTSAALESPQDMCNRIYGESPKGAAISKLLEDAS